jgi:hypothetical protein
VLKLKKCCSEEVEKIFFQRRREYDLAKQGYFAAAGVVLRAGAL